MIWHKANERRSLPKPLPFPPEDLRFRVHGANEPDVAPLNGVLYCSHPAAQRTL